MSSREAVGDVHLPYQACERCRAGAWDPSGKLETYRTKSGEIKKRPIMKMVDGRLMLLGGMFINDGEDAFQGHYADPRFLADIKKGAGVKCRRIIPTPKELKAMRKEQKEQKQKERCVPIKIPEWVE